MLLISVIFIQRNSLLLLESGATSLETTAITNCRELGKFISPHNICEL